MNLPKGPLIRVSAPYVKTLRLTLLEKQSEIWSTITNVGELQYIVTSSEDQTCKLWKVDPQ